MANDKNNNYVLQRSNVCSLNHFRHTKINRSNLNMSMSQQLSKSSHRQFLITPQSMAEAMEYAKMIAGSSFCPKDMRDKPGDVLIAVQMGAELGLSPIQALQNISVINGRPCVWGDAALALAQSCPHYVSHKEWEETTADGLVAYCEVTRKGSEPYIKCFSQKDAEKAGLWRKAGPWQQYPSRMLQMRARGFALRDKFSDALKGLITREEAMDCPEDGFIPKVVPITTKQSNVSQMITQTTLSNNSEPEDYDFDKAIEDIDVCVSFEELTKVYTEHFMEAKKRRDVNARSKLVSAYTKKKLDLERAQFLDEFDATTGEVAEVSSEVACAQ